MSHFGSAVRFEDVLRSSFLLLTFYVFLLFDKNVVCVNVICDPVRLTGRQNPTTNEIYCYGRILCFLRTFCVLVLLVASLSRVCAVC